MNNLLTIFASFIFFTTTLYAQVSKEELHQLSKSNHKVLTYTDARKAMFNQIYLEKESQEMYVQDVYCLEKFKILPIDVTNGRLPDSSVLNTEHTWPQSKFSKFFSGSMQKADLHHLFPAGSVINGERGNLPFAEVNGTDVISCTESKRGTSVGGERGVYFEPQDKHKGNVARAMFYFSVRYKMAIDKTQEYFLRMWHREDPVDEAEKLHHERIFQVQGNRNPFIDNEDLVRQVEDF